jgi:outer membrane protein
MRLILSALLVAGIAMPSAAQTARATLTLAEALDIAKKNNPNFLQSISGRVRASAANRTAWGQLIPSASASMGALYREGRVEYFGGQPFGSNVDLVQSSWGLDANMRLSYGTLTSIRQSNASLDAADADVETALYVLHSAVTAQFLLTLQTQARATLQDTLVVQQRLQLELAQARAGVGSGTSLDVKRAQVSLGTQQVAALRARNTAEVARLQLFQQLGVPMNADVSLIAELPVTAPTLAVEELLTMARQVNPVLRSVRARERVAEQGVKAARGAYTPSLNLRASIGGNAQALANEAFPTDFERNPYQISAGLSLPLFDGFAREQRLQEASVNRSDAEYAIRRTELLVVTDVTSTRVTLQAAYEAVGLQTTNAATAREALQLAEERYRVGANTFVDLTTARSEYERAETDRIDAVYEFHRAFAALEAAVGRTLR